MSKVALTRGNSRFESISKALNLALADYDWSSCNFILIKPNFVSTTNQLAATHVDAVRAVIRFVREHTGALVVIGEGTANSNTWEGFLNFGYMKLREEFTNVTFLDLNDDEITELTAYTRSLKPQQLHVALTPMESNCVISVGPPKVHDTVIFTGSLKNVVMGSIVNRDTVRMPLNSRKKRLLAPVKKRLKKIRFLDDLRDRALNQGLSRHFTHSHKVLMHQGYSVINLNLFVMAFQGLHPHISVIDGWDAMEGPGPTEGDPVPWRIAVVSTDFLAADSLTSWMMGFPSENVGYLHYCAVAGLGEADISKMEIVGDLSPEEAYRPFKPHPLYGRQVKWRDPKIEAMVEGIAMTRILPGTGDRSG